MFSLVNIVHSGSVKTFLPGHKIKIVLLHKFFDLIAATISSFGSTIRQSMVDYPKMSSTMKDLPENERRILLNQETGIVTWPELQRHFARGVLICVAESLDLVNVADAFVIDNKTAMQQWQQEKLIQPTPDEVAKRWANDKVILWAIVIAPWVLVRSQ